MRLILILALICAGLRAPLYADEYHYKGVLIGERAIGLGGAFVPLADDPSATFYNPAGLAYAPSGKFTGTANAFSTTEYRYRNIAPNQDYVLNSSGLIPAYFGLTNTILGIKGGFTITVPDSDIIDQNDDIKNFSTTSGETNEVSRKLAQRQNIYQMGVGLAYPINDQWSIGASFLGVLHINSVVNMQYTTYNPLPTGKYLFRELNLNTENYDFLPKLGVLFKADPTLSFGAMISHSFNVTGSGSGKIVQNKTDANGQPVTPTGSADHDVVVVDYPNVYHDDPEAMALSLGAAKSFSDWLVTVQLDYTGSDPSFRTFLVKPVINWSAGVEWKGIPFMPFRFGIFSDNANTPRIGNDANNQAPNVDLFGLVISGALHGDKTSTTLAISYALGDGKASVVQNASSPQILHEKTLMVYLSGSYQL